MQFHAFAKTFCHFQKLRCDQKYADSVSWSRYISFCSETRIIFHIKVSSESWPSPVCCCEAEALLSVPETNESRFKKWWRPRPRATVPLHGTRMELRCCFYRSHTHTPLVLCSVIIHHLSLFLFICVFVD